MLNDKNKIKSKGDERRATIEFDFMLQGFIIQLIESSVGHHAHNDTQNMILTDVRSSQAYRWSDNELKNRYTHTRTPRHTHSTTSTHAHTHKHTPLLLFLHLLFSPQSSVTTVTSLPITLQNIINIHIK